jgi:hypothetical protein
MQAFVLSLIFLLQCLSPRCYGINIQQLHESADDQGDLISSLMMAMQAEAAE